MNGRKTYHFISLGCAKNSVDSDSMAELLDLAGYEAEKNLNRADVLVVNTCGFIQAAREESYRLLREVAKGKRPGQLLIAAGCMTQRYGSQVAEQVPGIDGILGTRRWMDIVDLVQRLRQARHPGPICHLPESATIGADPAGVDGGLPPLRASVAGASAYLKIADGCQRPCAFCAIPLIKGTAVSRPMNAILEDCRRLRDVGVRELVLIAQDTTDYGRDLGMQDGLAALLEQMTLIVPDVDWIRILYAYPGCVSERLIEMMASHRQVLPYLDMPLQHAHPQVLHRMQRPANMDWVYKTIDRMRTVMPDLAIRTSFIVGYPGETEQEFQALLDFVGQVRFDRIGTFQFSFEAGTSGEALGDPVPVEVKEERYQLLMSLQQGISLQINQSFVGKTLDVLIEGRKKGISIGRSYRDAPEIDGLVFVEGKSEIGEIVPVRITGAMAYDLTGVPAQET